MISAVAAATSSSTTGPIAEDSRAASRFALKWARFSSSKRAVLQSSRERLWITRTPEMFSCNAALTAEMARRHFDEILAGAPLP